MNTPAKEHVVSRTGKTFFDHLLIPMDWSSTISLVTWKDTATAKQLTSAADITAAQTAGLVEIKQPGVVNMPILVWPGGKR